MADSVQTAKVAEYARLYNPVLEHESDIKTNQNGIEDPPAHFGGHPMQMGHGHG
jgi:hypothetical protein